MDQPTLSDDPCWTNVCGASAVQPGTLLCSLECCTYGKSDVCSAKTENEGNCHTTQGLSLSKPIFWKKLNNKSRVAEKHEA